MEACALRYLGPMVLDFLLEINDLFELTYVFSLTGYMCATALGLYHI